MPDSFATLLLENVQPRAGRGAWHGGPTSLGALRGVSAAQAVWVPAPGRKSIWQLALHIAYWQYAVRRRLEGGEAPRFPRSPANWPTVPSKPDTMLWAGDVALLKSQHAQLVATIAKIPSSRYGTALPDGKRWTLGELIVGIAQHDAYHTGQIQMLKRLWKTAHAMRKT
ncbi:MAG TPA: DinB family protein [Gemmatimonadaceae bacterium]|nr:DinB family protein [Gemmatimonadaceae bacterium]